MPHTGYRQPILTSNLSLRLWQLQTLDIVKVKVWLYWNCCWVSRVKINFSGLFQVMEAEQARTRSEAEHKKTALHYHSCNSHMRQLERKLRRSVNKSRSVLLFPFVMDSKWAYPPAWASFYLSVFVCEKERFHLRHAMKSRCFVCWLSSVGVYSLCKGRGMWLLIEECYSYSSFSIFLLLFSQFFLFLCLQAIFWTESQVLCTAWGMYISRLLNSLNHFFLHNYYICHLDMC